MKKQYLVMVQHARQVKENRWMNVRAWEDGHRYYESIEQAEKALRRCIATYNKDFRYDKDGKRIETQTCGMLGVGLEITKSMDDEDRIVAWKIKVREVTEWEDIDSKTL